MEIFDKIASAEEALAQENPVSAEEIEQFRIKYLGAKGILKNLFGEMSAVAPESRKTFGQRVNNLRETAEAKFQALKEQAGQAATGSKDQKQDLTAPAEPYQIGSRHPLSITLNRITQIFSRIGFTIAEDREIEDDWHNFTALNTAEDHPARDMQDTYYLKDSTSMLLRTHTSNVQARFMESHQPPIRIIAPGRVYRNETVSARSHCQFHQVEGLYVDEGVSFADMKQAILYFAKEMYGHDAQIRLRPSFFPFTEPSAEVDVTCFVCNAKGCNICKYSGWVEIMGCGMVDPTVLENCGIDSARYTGYAFGMGIERQAMLLYRINDIRLFFENDTRFLKQFSSAF